MAMMTNDWTLVIFTYDIIRTVAVVRCFTESMKSLDEFDQNTVPNVVLLRCFLKVLSLLLKLRGLKTYKIKQNLGSFNITF